MSLPGFTAEIAAGRPIGKYIGGAHGASVSQGVSPQDRTGGFGPILGNCCCISCDFFGFPVAIGGFEAPTRHGRFPGNSPVVPQLSDSGWRFGLGPCSITCTTCPDLEGECQCTCQENGLPCASVGGLEACE
jgi:hypothetical protein